MALPQIEAALLACERRDADLALQFLEAVHAANAPLQCGKKGSSFMESVVSRLKRIALRYGGSKSETERETHATNFAGMLAEARRQQLEHSHGR